VLEFANVISYWDRFIITDKAVDLNRPDIVLIHRGNKTATLHIAVPFTHKLPKTEGEKIMTYEHLDLEIKNIWKHNSVSTYPLVISAGGVIKNFLKYVENYGLNKSILTVGQKAVLLQMCHIVCKFLGHAP